MGHQDLAWRDKSGLAGVAVAVIGMARTGRATARALLDRGARVIAYDARSIEVDDDIAALMDTGLSLHCGDGFPGIERADILVPSPGMRAESHVLQDALHRNVPVLSEVEIAYRISLAPMIAFTGTNGKSTTTALCGHMLQKSGIRAKVGGNLAPGTPLVTLAHEASPKDVLVAEISSFQLEWVEEFRPRVSAVLNVSEEHLDRHPDVATYAAVKARIAARGGGADLAVYGDRFARDFPELLLGEARRMIFATAHPVESGAYLDRGRIRVVGRTDPAEGSLPDLLIDASRFTLPGLHNAENAMAAALAALEMGARPEAIERALRTFEGLPHRMEEIATVDGVRFVNNSMCTNLAAALASLDAAPEGVVVITGGRSKGLDMQPFGEALAHRSRWSVLIGEMAPQMEAYIRGAGSAAVERAPSMEEAVAAAARRAAPGDTVILIPGFSSFDMFTDFEMRGRTFARAVEQRAQAASAVAGNGLEGDQ